MHFWSVHRGIIYQLSIRWNHYTIAHCTIVNPPDEKQAKPTSVHCNANIHLPFTWTKNTMKVDGWCNELQIFWSIQFVTNNSLHLTFCHLSVECATWNSNLESYLLHREWYKRFLEECPEGVLRKPDMVAMYSQILPQEDPSVIIEHLFRIFDRDGDGTIDFKEFVLATEITTSGQPEEKLRWTFKVQLLTKDFWPQ